MQWCSWLAAGNEAADLLGKNVVIQLRYEDLVTHPEYELMNICRTLGLEFNPCMLEVTEREKDPVLATESAYAHRNLEGPVDATRAKAGQDLPDWACHIVERYAGRALKDLGYNCNGRSRSIGLIRRLKVAADLLLSEKKLRDQLQKENTRLGRASVYDKR
jgi:hypothetical protein